jgi:formamidopyrimidine-DNA glycosylase
MPELPEMENYKKLLTRMVVGKIVTGVEVNREKSINVPYDKFEQRVLQQTITAIERRAKHLLFHLRSSDVLLLHLMLGGWMFYGREAQKPERSAQIILTFGAEHLYFHGLRLGYLHLHTLPEVEERLSGLGPEPLDPQFTEQMLRQRLESKRGVLKAALLDQKWIAGIGNCYSDEICFAAALLPTRKVNDLNDAEKTHLYRAIRAILSEASQIGGYMEYPLYEGDRLTGMYDDRCRVYDREGQPCVRCGQPVVRQEIASRKSFCCTNCQH